MAPLFVVNLSFLLMLAILEGRYKGVYGDAEVLVRFDVYQNAGGKGDNGNCCDGRWGICQNGGCDHKFTVCMDSHDSDDLVIGPVRCWYGRYWTRPVENQDNITFTGDVGGLDNPLKFNITGTLPTKFALKVDVWDDDASTIGMGDDDHVDFLRRTVYTMDSDVMSMRERAVGLHNRTTLGVTMVVRCAPHYYLATCSRYCEPPSPGQHYRCDPQTGFKVYHKDK